MQKMQELLSKDDQYLNTQKVIREYEKEIRYLRDQIEKDKDLLSKYHELEKKNQEIKQIMLTYEMTINDSQKRGQALVSQITDLHTQLKNLQMLVEQLESELAVKNRRLNELERTFNNQLDLQLDNNSFMDASLMFTTQKEEQTHATDP